ncbi:MAG: RecX family transcriptional regulator [Clostridia bacterium]|nr:RecX family transcriptional regulator [Clostridia bacterium]
MEIKSFKLKSKSNSNIFEVDTSKGVFLLYADIMVKEKISKGEIADESFAIAVKESAVLIATDMAVKYLTSAIKTEKQLKDYLLKKGFDFEVIDKVKDKLKRYNLLDDKNFAVNYIKCNPKFSANKLKQKLSGFGIKKEDYLPLFEDFDDTEICYVTAQKFLKNKIVDKKTTEKLIRHLTNKGFNFGTIKTILNRLKIQSEEE